jgi:hypothetical protein
MHETLQTCKIGLVEWQQGPAVGFCVTVVYLLDTHPGNSLDCWIVTSRWTSKWRWLMLTHFVDGRAMCRHKLLKSRITQCFYVGGGGRGTEDRGPITIFISLKQYYNIKNVTILPCYSYRATHRPSHLLTSKYCEQDRHCSTCNAVTLGLVRVTIVTTEI